MSPIVSSIPTDAAAFAAEHGATEDFLAVLALARRIFPTASISPRLETDAEMQEESTIVVEADVAGLTAPQLIAAQRQWSEGLFACCPSTHAHLFCLRMV